MESIRIGDNGLISLTFRKHLNKIAISIKEKDKGTMGLVIDRSQAHFLKMFLEEYLK
jgi:hypothetical protein